VGENKSVPFFCIFLIEDTEEKSPPKSDGELD
jgi:hypothetical protein